MSLRMQYSVTCDRCPHQTMLFPSAKQARRAARNAGWRRIPRGHEEDTSPGGRGTDICWRHQGETGD